MGGAGGPAMALVSGKRGMDLEKGKEMEFPLREGERTSVGIPSIITDMPRRFACG